MGKRGSHQKAPTLWQRIWPIALGVTALAAVTLVLMLSGQSKFQPLVSTSNPITTSAFLATEESSLPQEMVASTAPYTSPYSTALSGNGNLETATATPTKASSSPTPSPTPQPSPVDLAYPYYIEINKGAQIVTIYTVDRDGTYTLPVRYMLCSTGVSNKTPDGLFRTKTKYRWQRMLASTTTYAQYATRITGSFLFHSVNFTSMSSDTLKVENYNNLGFKDSGGCVRLQVADAKWIYDNVPTGTPVKIYSGAPMPEVWTPLLPSLLDKSAKWDPSDPNPDNPAPKAVPGATILNTPYPGVTPAPLTEKFSNDVPRVTRTLPPDQ